MPTASTSIQTQAIPRVSAIAAGLFIAMLGVGLIVMSGFANSATLHNAAHDSRHSLAFPCH